MPKWNLVIDVAACTNCNNCVVATQDEYAGNDFPGYSAPGAPDVRTIEITRHVRGAGSMVDVQYVPRLCNHCDDAPCVAAGKGAIAKRSDGIVIVDPERARGRRDLADACPYGAIVWNQAQQVPQNWIFDAHLIDQGWKEPRAAHVCPTRAIRALKLEDVEMADLARRERLEVLRPELGTRPRVYYRNLGLALFPFIGGNVTANGENVEGADVALLRDGREVAQERTDAFGDFRFDHVPSGSEGYAVRVRHDRYGFAEQEIAGQLDASAILAIALG